MSDNWIVQNLNSALSTWSEKMAELWTLLTEKKNHRKRRNKAEERSDKLWKSR